MKTLHLTLKKKWFDMIASGEKKEEYREDKAYWRRRLLHRGIVADGKLFHEVQFRNGYRADSPKMRFNVKAIEPGEGRPEWGAVPGEWYFVIKLGERID